MSSALGRSTVKLLLDPEQAITFGGEVWTFRGRASDRERRLMFDRKDGLVRDFSDRELLKFQSEGKLRFLSLAEKEAFARKHPGNRPRETLDTCDKANKERGLWIRAYVRGWEQAGRPPRTPTGLTPVIADVAREMKDHTAMSVRSLQRFITLSEATGGDPEAFVKQTVNQGNYVNRLSHNVFVLLDEWVATHYLVEPRPTLPYVFAMVMEEFKAHNKILPPGNQIKPVGRSAVYEMIRMVDRYTETFCHRGKNEADHKYRMLEDGPVTERHNQTWEIDHTTVDLMVRDGQDGPVIGRPIITMAIDRHTRMITGYHVSWDFPGINPTVECLRCAISPKDAILAKVKDLRNPWPAFGAPDEIVTDNAKHFYSKAFKEVCQNLGMDPSRAPLLKAWFKGRIERVFGTYVRGLCHLVPGTTFSNIFQRLKERPPEKVAVCTLAQFEEMLIRFIVDIYHPRRHRIMNTSPLIAYQESMSIHGMKRPPNPDELASKLAITLYRTIQRDGINYEGLWYRGPVLFDLMVNKRLSRIVKIKVDPMDLTRIWFIHPATNAPVALKIQKSMREKITGITLAVHKLALSMQRNNPELLAGEDGISSAYGLIGKMMESRMNGDGLKNRVLAAKHMDKLRVRAEAYAVQDAGDEPLAPLEEREISEELFAQVADDALPTNVIPFPGAAPANPPGGETATDDPAPMEPAPKAKPPRTKKPKPAEPSELSELLPTEDDIDLDALVQGNTTIQDKDDDHE